MSGVSASQPLEPRPRSWRDRWLDWRNARLADPGFRRWAASFWLTRPLTRRRARSVFDLMAGFVYTQVLLACVRLRLFDLLATRPHSTAELAARVGVGEAPLQRLLDAATALRLLERRDSGHYTLGVLGAPLVGDDGIAAMVEHHAVLYGDIADPVALLRHDSSGGAGGSMAAYWTYANTAQPGALQAEQVAHYSALMSASLPMVAQEVLDAYPLQQHRRLLDVGGGEGRFLSAVAQRAPHLQLHLFDLPAVAERARERLTAQGLGERCSVSGGDFLQDELPSGADIVTLVRVAFDHPDATVLRILQAVRRALPVGGTVLLAEPMSGTPGAEAMGDAYFGFYLLAMGKGRPRTPAQLGALLEAAGFGSVRLLPTHLPLQARAMVALAR